MEKGRLVVHILDWKLEVHAVAVGTDKLVSLLAMIRGGMAGEFFQVLAACGNV